MPNKTPQTQNPNPPAPSSTGSGYSGGPHFPHPPDPFNPDPETLRQQWRYAIKQYSKWYSQAWGTAILAGVSFFALGWLVKGSNPLPSFGKNDQDGQKNHGSELGGADADGVQKS
ncbi:uncharacterized protein LOC141677431 [Apium graveolens]|uniref:uncharacterized protein LOC141677431 n=1 Tax=Apium graveolens TaxID=4045 RepID=UPI003D7939AE